MKISDEMLIEDLKRVGVLLDKIPTQNEYSKYGKYSTTTFTNRKSWNIWLIETYGNSNRAIKWKNGNKISEEDLKTNLLNVYKDLGKVPKKEDLKYGKYGVSGYNRVFGNFTKAIIAVGLKPYQQRDLTSEDVIEDLKELYLRLGHVPTISEYWSLSSIRCGSSSIKKRFGSWFNALIKAGIPAEKAHIVSKQDVINALNEWYEQNNNDTRCLEYWKIRKAGSNGKFPYNCSKISKIFNMSWEDIMKQVDPKYETVNQFVKRGSFLGIDGNIYLSSIEKTVGDILYNFKIENKIISYEYEHSVCPERSWTCDFFINETVWLEVDGMRSNRKDPYNDNNEKIEYYKTNNFNYKILSYNHCNIKQFISSILREA